MILQALTKYYDILSNDPDSGVSPIGYSLANISFALNLSQNGELTDIFPLVRAEQRGKQMVDAPQRMIVPEQVKRAGINPNPNFLCDSCAFVLGISDKDEADPTYSKRRFEAFKKHNLDLLSKADCIDARAVIAFLEAYEPQKAREHPLIGRFWDGLIQGAGLVFKLEGNTGFIHEAPEIRRVWEEYKTQSANKDQGQCLVTGEFGPIARLHPSAKGVKDANPTGATLVGFNARAYESYNRNKGQGLNSPTGEKAAFAYTTALNYLLSRDNPNRKFVIGDTTVVYWAESPNDEYASIFSALIYPDYFEEGKQDNTDTPGRAFRAEQRMKEIAEKVKTGRSLDLKNLMEDLDGTTRFYVLGLAPNAARLSVRFFHQDPFEKIVNRILAHYQDLQIVKEYQNQPERITLRNILDETVSKKASDKSCSPLLAGSIMRSILNNTPYPAALYNSLINRIRADMDDASKRIRKINYFRAAIFKAFLLRKYRRQPDHPIQEVLTMSLNEESTLPAYVLGRLFAVLEKAQQEAIGDVNASIKDRYFTSACASPSSVFPVLLRLSQHHISKAERGKYLDSRIEKILDRLDVERNPIPAHLSLDEQGVFVLGYYHQRADFYVPRKEKEETRNE